MSPDDRSMLAELRRRGDPVSVRAAERFETYFKMDCEAAEHVESVIAMRTGFTGDPPYVGWKGLGLAMEEVFDAKESFARALISIALFPVTDPKNQDAMNMAEIAKQALKWSEASAVREGV